MVVVTPPLVRYVVDLKLEVPLAPPPAPAAAAVFLWLFITMLRLGTPDELLPRFVLRLLFVVVVVDVLLSTT